MGRGWGFISVTILNALAGTAVADADEPADPPTIAPAAEHRMLGRVGLGGGSFSADGQSVFVLSFEESVNLWVVAADFWPEIASGLLAFLALLTLLGVRRAVRRRQIPGKLHCRRCLYCLEGCPTDVCPECGYQRARPRAIRGRSLARRLAVVAVAFCVFGGAAAAFWLGNWPRPQRRLNWPCWWSDAALKWAAANSKTWITRHSQSVWRIVRLDAADGTARETLCTSTELGVHRLLATPDRSRLIVVGVASDLVCLRAFDAISGRLVRAVRRSHARVTSDLTAFDPVAGVSADNRAVYINSYDVFDRVFVCVRWDFGSDTTTEVVRVADDTHAGPDSRTPRVGYRFCAVPGARGDVLVGAPVYSLPGPRQLAQGPPAQLHVSIYPADDARDAVLRMPAAPWSSIVLADASDHSFHHVIAFDGSRIRSWDAQQEAGSISELLAPAGVDFAWYAALRGPRDRLFIPVLRSGDVLIADGRSPVWTARLCGSRGDYVRTLDLAPAGDRLLVAREHDVLIFDLPP